MKRIISLALALITLATCLVSCGGANYKDNVSVSTLKAKALAEIPLADGYSEGDSDYLDFKFKNAADHIDGYSLNYSTDGRNINFVGIFHAKSPSDAKSVSDICETFLKSQKKAFEDALANYNAGEADKFDSAAVKTFGNYVVVVILSKADSNKVLSAIENELKAE